MMHIRNIISKRKDRYLKDLKEYIAIQSVSSDQKHRSYLQKAARWISKRMVKAGLENVKQIKTKGNPIVYADWLHAKGKPTILFYGHYDVMPPDPLDQWKSDPFKLTIRGGEIFGRGVADNKAPHLSHILGVEVLLNAYKSLPVNVKFMIEGEEEIGSPNIRSILKRYRRLFDSDVAFVSDNQMDFDRPTLVYGLRGILYCEISVKCFDFDLHSGAFGGMVDNPAIVLSYIISKIKDRNGRIQIPRFYDDVRRVSKFERNLLKEVEITRNDIKKTTGATNLFGEKGYMNIERKGVRPTFDVNGIWSGYTLEGMKTIIPATANAKVSMRLVPYQKAKKIGELFEKYIKKIAPKTCSIDVKFLGLSDPIIFDWKNDYLKVAKKVFSEVFKSEAKFKLEGGSIGAVVDIKNILGIDSILVGFGLPDCGMHSPNEKLPVDNFFKAIEVTVEYLKNVGS